jgi:hypothetical protein
MIDTATVERCAPENARYHFNLIGRFSGWWERPENEKKQKVMNWALESGFNPGYDEWNLAVTTGK